MIAGTKSVFAGTAIGMALPTILIVAVLFDEFGRAPGETFLAMLIPFGVGFAASSIGLLVIGGPITAWLSRRGQESWRAYFVCGVVGGAVPVFLIMVVIAIDLFVAALIVAGFGALTGGAVGHFWWVFGRKKSAFENTDAIKQMFG